MKPVILFLAMGLAAVAAANAQSASKAGVVPSGLFPAGGPGDVHQLQLTVGGALDDGYRQDGNSFTRGFFEPGIQQLHMSGRQPVYGLRYGGWISFAIFGFGLHGVYHTNFPQGSLRIKPEVLLGVPSADLRSDTTFPLPGTRILQRFASRILRFR